MNDATASTSPAAPRKPVARRIARVLGWTAGVLLVLAGLAAWLLPGYLKGVAVEQIRAQLQREASIESIAVNPLTMSVRIKALAINDADGRSNLFRFDELYTRIGLESILRGAPVIEELSLVKPRINLARLAEERYNISDILERLLAGPPDPRGPRFALNSLSITDAELVFDDKPAGRIHRVEKMQISLPALSAFEDDRGLFAEPTLSAIVNGHPLQLKGRTKPFDASLETIVALNFADVDIPHYLAYSPVRLPVRIDKGSLTTALDVVVIRAKDNSLSASVKGTVRIADVSMRDAAAPDGGAVAVLRGIDVKIAELAWPQNVLRLDSVTIDGPQVHVRREKDGSINWRNMLARLATEAAEPKPGTDPALEARNGRSDKVAIATAAGAPTATDAATAAGASAAAGAVPAAGKPPESATSASPPLRYSVADARIAEGIVLYEDDAAPAGRFRVVTRPIAMRATNLSNADNAEAAIEATLATDGDEEVAYAGTLRLAPLAAAGNVSLKRVRLSRYQPYYGDVLAAELDGLVDVEANIAFGDDGNLKVSELRVGGTDWHVREKARGDVVRIGALAVAGGAVDLHQQAVNVGSIALRQCRATLARDKGGRLNVLSWIRTAVAAPASGGATTPATRATPVSASAGASQKDWVVDVRQASLERCAVQFEDLAASQGAATAARIVLDPLDVRIANWSSRTDNRARIEAQAKVNGGGQLSVKGVAGMAPLVADLDLDLADIDLVPMQPYAADRLNVRMTSGVVSTRGKLALSGSPLAIRYRGDAALARLASTTKADGEDFLNWGALRAQGLDLAVNAPATPGAAAAPFSLALDELALSEFYSRLIVNADGTLNVQYVVREPAGDPAASAAASVGITSPAASPGASGAPAAAASGTPTPPPVTINRITLTAGKVNFSDRFIKPNYSANINDVSGSVTGLSSDFASRASVDIKGRYDPSAPVEIKGTINPLRGNLFLDIAASCRDVELVQFTPYAQKYAGYGITKGKLSLSVKYQIDDRKLTADNSLRLDQLTFGEKVESPDATKLPVLFAVSLLKNAKGEIDLDLPVTGSLDDPQFSVFAIVLKIIGNLLAKAATAPFALIGALVGGGGEDLAYVEFQPGIAGSVAPGQEEKLAKIAKALNERPALRLDIAGNVDPVADREALHKRALLRKLAAQRQDDSARVTSAGSAPPETIAIPPDEYPVLLKRAYESEKLGGKPGEERAKTGPVSGATDELPPAEMEKRLLERITVTSDELRELGERRANAAKSTLGKLGVDGERMFIVVAVDKADGKRAPRAEFVLK